MTQRIGRDAMKRGQQLLEINDTDNGHFCFQLVEQLVGENFIASRAKNIWKFKKIIRNYLKGLILG